MPTGSVERRRLVKVRGKERAEEDDWVVVEEPLELRVGDETLAILMRTPGHDIELAAGFALTEGLVRSARELGVIRHCEDESAGKAGAGNVVTIALAPGVSVDRDRLRRNLVASAACGLCGKTSIEAIATQAEPIRSGLRIGREVLAALPDRLRREQGFFQRTGALHAAGLFSGEGALRLCREDVGRHNAVDKVIGRALIDSIPLSETVLLVSGRTSFEILQKAAVAGIPVVCAVSGPTTLAIDTARTFGITLINFLRDGGMNIATGAERVTDT